MKHCWIESLGGLAVAEIELFDVLIQLKLTEIGGTDPRPARRRHGWRL